MITQLAVSGVIVDQVLLMHMFATTRSQARNAIEGSWSGRRSKQYQGEVNRSKGEWLVGLWVGLAGWQGRAGQWGKLSIWDGSVRG